MQGSAPLPHPSLLIPHPRQRAHLSPNSHLTPRTSHLADAIDRLLVEGRQTAWAGYDPYDALRSPVVRALSFNAKWPRVAWIQLLKRSPVNLRPLLLVSKSVNPKTLGLVARATVF